ncbi:Abi family protein [Limnospira platensis CENA597]|uniref:Abi family protein n=1 Tax=Oscillatoriales TaxID=1150 RepID=UPI00396F6D6C
MNHSPLSEEIQSALKEALSTVRLQPYLRVANGQIDQAITIYQLNVQLCGAIYPSIHIFEITFRNKMNQVLTNRYGGDWYLNPDVIIGSYESESIDKVRNELRRLKKPLVMNKIVPRLTLGFWSSLLIKKEYKQIIFDQCIQEFFPYAQPRERNFATIAPSFRDKILRLRNRVFHHEPIWSIDYNVEEKYQYLCRVLRWMSPEVHEWLKTYDNFPEQYRFFQ